MLLKRASHIECITEQFVVIFHRLVFVLCAAFLAMGCAEPDQPYVPGPRPVQTVTVEAPRDHIARSFSGIAQAARDTALSFRIAGVLQELSVQVGDRVQAGEPIAELDSRDVELKVLEVEALTAQAQAAFTQARADYQRVRGLYEVGSVSRSDLDQAQAGFETTRAQLVAVNKNLDQARLNSSFTRLVAPTAGSISQVPVENFQTLQAGQPVAVLSTDEDLEFEAGIPDRLIHQLRIGDPAEVVFDVLPDKAFPAVVSEVAVTTGPLSAFPITLRLEEPTQRIRPGMIGSVRLNLPNNANTDSVESFTVIPPEAVFGLSTGEQMVWLVDPDSKTVHRRQVTVGRLVPEGLQILDGLAGGEILVTRGVHRLEEDQEVRILENGS